MYSEEVIIIDCHNMKRALIVILFVLALSSCSSAIKYISLEPAYNEQWTDRTHADIVATYGAPDRVESDGLDGSILVYETMIDYSEKEYTHFFIGADKRCYAVKTNLIEADPDSVKKSNRTFWASTGISCGVLILLTIILSI